MLGNLLSEISGKRTGRRVVSTEPVKVEVTFEGNGKAVGVEVHEIGTYWSEIRCDGTLYGEGGGVLMGGGGESAIWKGAGIGKFGEGGAVSYRGAIYFSASSPKLARLNSVVGVFEYNVDAGGNTNSKIWEWK